MKLKPFVTSRYWKLHPLEPVANMEACRAPAFIDSRIITPALAPACVTFKLATRATISVFPWTD